MTKPPQPTARICEADGCTRITMGSALCDRHRNAGLAQRRAEAQEKLEIAAATRNLNEIDDEEENA